MVSRGSGARSSARPYACRCAASRGVWTSSGRGTGPCRPWRRVRAVHRWQKRCRFIQLSARQRRATCTSRRQHLLAGTRAQSRWFPVQPWRRRRTVQQCVQRRVVGVCGSGAAAAATEACTGADATTRRQVGRRFCHSCSGSRSRRGRQPSFFDSLVPVHDCLFRLRTGFSEFHLHVLHAVVLPHDRVLHVFHAHVHLLPRSVLRVQLFGQSLDFGFHCKYSRDARQA